MDEHMGKHFVCSGWAGFVAIVIGSPVDVVKTRLMNSKKGSADAYTGVINCVVRTYQNEGFGAFYAGFSSNASRLISWNIIMFMIL
jgi:solute carrier family 25 uncoupling protein 8/9